MGHSPFFQSPTNHYPIMPTVTLKSDTYHRLETLVTSFEDTPETVIQRLLDACAPGTIDEADTARILTLDPDDPDDLHHTKIAHGHFAGHAIDGRNWSDLAKLAHRVLAARCDTPEAIADASPFNVRAGRYEQDGYRHLPALGISIQYHSAIHMWAHTHTLAQHLGVPVVVHCTWHDKPEAAHPGVTARLAWTPPVV